MTFDVWKQAKIQNGLDKVKTFSVPEQNIDNIKDLKKLAGVSENTSNGMNMSVTGTQKGELMKKHNIQPGTPEWFQLWFSLPYMTGEKPVGK